MENLKSCGYCVTKQQMRHNLHRLLKLHVLCYGRVTAWTYTSCIVKLFTEFLLFDKPRQ